MDPTQTGQKAPHAGKEAVPFEHIPESEKLKLLQLSEISIWLDTYDDIFSDFDPRPYSQRALSDDFLFEAKRAAREKKTGGIELKLLLPADKRSGNEETVIKKRLREYFKKQFESLQKEIKGIRLKGVSLLAVGFALMFFATLVSYNLQAGILWTFAFVLLEPTGWFVIWFGFEHLFYTVNQKKPELGFFKKMAGCNISFLPY
jgi:hypothetical protein